jgi:hypothetical protein
MRIQPFVMTCAERTKALTATLSSLKAANWNQSHPCIVVDDAQEQEPLARIHATWRRMVRLASQCDADYALLLEDDVIFCKWFTCNLLVWPLLKSTPRSSAFYASLYNPGLPFVSRNVADCYAVADPRWVWGSQALLVSVGTLRYIDRNWDKASGNPDMRMPRIVRPVTPVYHHLPSLVDHADTPTTWGGIEHHAPDFDCNWRSPHASPPVTA